MSDESSYSLLKAKLLLILSVMEERIVYTARNKKTTLNADELSGQRIYLKHIYHNDELQKTETYFKGELLSIEIYIQDEHITDEEILFLTPFISAVTIIRVKKYGHYRLFHFRKYSKCKLDSEEIRVKDSENRLLSLFYPNKEDYHHQKSIYSTDGEDLSFEYFSTGQPLLKNMEILRRIEAFSAIHSLEISKSFYLSFFPFLPTGDSYEVENCRYFTGYNFMGEIEIELQQAFFEKDFIKKIYSKDVLQEIIYFENRKVIRRKYFIRNDKKVDLENLEYEVEIYHLDEEKNGFTKWDVECYKNNLLHKRKIKVYDILGKKIGSQWIDPVTGKPQSTKKHAYYYNSKYNEWNGFEYDENGKIIENEIVVDDFWDNEIFTINEIEEKGFFTTDFGKYFLTGSLEIPEPETPIHKHKKIYKNHLGNKITEKETQSLFEYSEEIFDNNRLKKRIIYTADSSEQRKENIYNKYVVTFHDDMKNLEEFELTDDEIYYNMRKENGYYIYDFAVRNEDYRNVVKSTGTAVYDNYYRLICRINYEENFQTVISAVKIHYSYIIPLLGNTCIEVHFNEQGEIREYIDNTISRRAYSKSQYEKDYFFENSSVNKEYYKSLNSLVPEKPAFPFFDFEYDIIKYRAQDNRESEMQLLFSESKLKVAWSGSYDCFYFVDDIQKVKEYSKALSNELGAAYFYNIEKTDSKIEADYFFSRGIKARFSMDIFSDEIDCEILNNHEQENKISFKLMDSSDFTNRYCFFYEEKWVSDSVIYSSLIKELLLKV